MSDKKLWEGDTGFKKNSHLYHFQHWLQNHYNLSFKDYHELWKWSVDNIEEFWKAIWDYFNIISHSPYKNILSGYNMPNCRWFEGSTLNYSEHIFRHANPAEPAIYFGNEAGDYKEISWNELKQKVASLAAYLRSVGVTKGDRVVAFLPNIPEATISFLAVNSLGAIWSSTSPDFGAESVVDRFAQIEPKVLITVDGYQYNGKPYDKSDIVNSIVDALPTLEKVIVLPYLNKKAIDNFPETFVDIENCF